MKEKLFSGVILQISLDLTGSDLREGVMERWREGEMERWREGEMERQGDGAMKPNLQNNPFLCFLVILKFIHEIKLGI